jgi:hypothetical protein
MQISHAKYDHEHQSPSQYHDQGSRLYGIPNVSVVS